MTVSQSAHRTSAGDPSASGPRVVVPRRLKWRHHLAAFLIFAAGRLISRTWRCRFLDPQDLPTPPRGPVIFCLWHNRLAISMTTWERHWRKKVQPSGLVALISASKDGGVLARTLQYFRVEAARGSSSRRGAQALLELTSWIDRGFCVAITPDGPRGPRGVVQDGVISLAQVTGLPIVPVSARVRWKLTLKSWDRFQVPLPFARCEILSGPPLDVPRELTDADREAIKRELQNRLNALATD